MIRKNKDIVTSLLEIPIEKRQCNFQLVIDDPSKSEEKEFQRTVLHFFGRTQNVSANSFFGIILCIILCIQLPYSAKATTATAPVSIQLKQLTYTNGNLQAVVELTTFDGGQLNANLKAFTTATRHNPVSDGEKYSLQANINGDTSIQFSITVVEPGDLQLRLIVSPIIGGPSSSVLRFIRIDNNKGITIYEQGDYSLLRANERAKETSHYGLRESRWGGWWKPDAHDEDIIERSAGDSLKRNTPKVIIGEGKSELIRSETAESSDRITILGNLKTVLNGLDVPLHYTEVQVWDHDPITPDDHLGTTRTDNAGNYNITVINDDGPGGGGIDVYLYVYSKNTKIATLQLVPDGQGGYTPFYYAWRSATHDDLKGPTATINYTITSDNLASTIWSGLSASQWLTESATSRVLSYVELRYPPFGTGTHAIGNIINIDPTYGDSPETVGHEYGHCVMYQAYGSQPDEAGGQHGFCETATAGLAWSEGFATWYGMAAWDGNGNFDWHIGGPAVSMEYWSCSLRDCNTDEGRAAAWMWDLYDIPSDNNGGYPDRGMAGYSDNNSGQQIVGTSVLLNTLWDRKQNDTRTYWSDLQSNLTSTQSAPSIEIGKYNYLITVTTAETNTIN